MAAIGGGHNHHGRALLSGSLLVMLVGQCGEGGVMQRPKGPSGLDFVASLALTKKRRVLMFDRG